MSLDFNRQQLLHDVDEFSITRKMYGWPLGSASAAAIISYLVFFASLSFHFCLLLQACVSKISYLRKWHFKRAPLQAGRAVAETKNQKQVCSDVCSWLDFGICMQIADYSHFLSHSAFDDFMASSQTNSQTLDISIAKSHFKHHVLQSSKKCNHIRAYCSWITVIHLISGFDCINY